ncbi:MAG: hypothetical protein ACI9U2_002084 [Bradymonadia bacterium]|jgi:hypothetical protein
MTGNRRFAVQCAASLAVNALLLAVCATTAAAAPQTPCAVAGLPAPLQALKARLTTRDPAAWATIARDAAALTEAGPPAARACAHYVAGAAWFYLSGRRTDRARHAISAVSHLVAAQALAPVAMQQRQPRSRLQTAWARVGQVDGWLPRRGRPVTVSLPARSGTVHLSPGDPTAWKATCAGACLARIRIPLSPKAPRSVHLRPGRWSVAWTTACGTRAHGIEIAGAGPIRLPDQPPCAVELNPQDGGKPIAEFAVRTAQGDPLQTVTAAHNPVTVTARGYLDETVRVSAKGGPLAVAMTRCAVQIVPHVRPPDAQVEGAGSQPWGAVQLRARRPGYRDLAQRVEVAAPKRCMGARHVVDLNLARPVAVIALDDAGEPVVPARLWINEEIVDAATLALPAGLYRFQAEHPGLGTVSGAFGVADCVDSHCPSARLPVRFTRVGRSRTGPWVVMGTGGLVAAIGLGFGVAAVNAQSDIDAYTTRQQQSFGLDTLTARRDDRAATADDALLAGGALIVGGLVWYLVGD